LQPMSELKFSCPNCNQHLSCDEGYAGRQISCPSCQSAVVVPQPVRPPPPALQISPQSRPAPAANPPPAPLAAAAGRSLPSRKVVKSLFLSLHKQEFTYTEGPPVVFDCPGCLAQGVAGNTQGTRERFMSFGLIPLFRVHYTDVACPRCRRSFRLPQKVETVAALAPEAIARGIRSGQIPFFIKFSIVTGVVLGVLPVVGLIFAAVGVVFTARKSSHWRTAGFVGLGLSLIATGVLVTMLLRSSAQNSNPHWPGSRRSVPTHTPAPRPVPPGPPQVASPQPPGRGNAVANPYQPGQRIAAQWAGQWLPGTVVENLTPFTCRVQLEDLRFRQPILLSTNMLRLQ